MFDDRIGITFKCLTTHALLSFTSGLSHSSDTLKELPCSGDKVVMVVHVFHSDPGMERFKFIFTLRDSPSDYVNVTCWGSEEYIKSLHSSFKICDVGELDSLMCSCDHF